MECRLDIMERASVWERQGSPGWLEQGSGSGQRSPEDSAKPLGQPNSAASGPCSVNVVQILKQRSGVCLKPLLASSPSQASRPVTAGLLH